MASRTTAALCAVLVALLATRCSEDTPPSGGCPRIPGCPDSACCTQANVCAERVCQGATYVCRQRGAVLAWVKAPASCTSEAGVPALDGAPDGPPRDSTVDGRLADAPVGTDAPRPSDTSVDKQQPRDQALPKPDTTCYGKNGNHGDSCAGVTAETWRCVYSSVLNGNASQVCRNGAWQSYAVNPRNCGGCCGAYTTACEQ